MAAYNWSLNGYSTEGESGNDGLVRSDSWQIVPVPSYCGNDSAIRAERAFTSYDASKRAASRISTERTITLLCSLSSLVDQPAYESISRLKQFRRLVTLTSFVTITSCIHIFVLHTSTPSNSPASPPRICKLYTSPLSQVSML